MNAGRGPERSRRSRASPRPAISTAAYRTALRAERHLPDNPDLKKLVQRITLPIRVNTNPAGAEVWVKGYETPDAPWERVGVTPLTLRIPYALMRWRITKEGYEPFEGAPLSTPRASRARRRTDSRFARHAAAGHGSHPRGTAQRTSRPGDEAGMIPAVQVPTFFLDRYEVTNRLFKEFVDAGGYEKPEYWPARSSAMARPSRGRTR